MADIKGLGFIQKRYTNLEEIGQGGMGVVYKATDTTLDRDVAIKVILPHFSSRPDFKESFEKEAKALANLEHPNIIPIYDYNSVKKGSYYVMALMTGKTLQDIISSGPMSADTFLQTARSLLAALGHAHANNILHRDIKSPNIFINDEGHTFLGDFGVALPSSEGSSSLASQQFHFQGTPAYASPEQIEGHRLTPASDIYSMGILFYEMLAGELPFTGSLNNVLTGQLTRKPPRLELNDPKIHHLTALVSRMLDKVPGNRPQNCDEVRNLLDHPELVSPLAPEEIEEHGDTQNAQAAINLTPDQLALQLAERIKLYKSRYNDAAKLLKQLEGSKSRIDKQMYKELKEKYSSSLEENMEALEELFHQAETCITELELMLKHDQDKLKEIEGKKTELRFLHEGKAINDEELKERSLPIDNDMEDVQNRIEARSERLNRLIGSLEKHHVTRVIPTIEKVLMWTAWSAAGITGAIILYLLFLSFTTVPGKIGNRTIPIFRQPNVNSRPAGKGWTKQLVSILSVKRAQKGEVITIRKTYLQSGLKLIEVKRGTPLIITGKTKNTFTVNYQIPGKGILRGATVSRSSVRRNSWYKIKTDDGAKGWALSQGVNAWRKSSVLKRFVFNIQWFFGKKTKSKKTTSGKSITGTLPGKKGWITTEAAKKNIQPIRFTFHLDAQGAAAISSALNKESAHARLTGLQSRANTLEELKTAFSDNDYAAAEKMIIGVSLVGDFNAWNNTANRMQKKSMGIYTIYTTDANIPFVRTNEAFGFQITIASSDRKVSVVVPDPLSSNNGNISQLNLALKKKKQKSLKVHVPTSVSTDSEDPNNPIFNLIDDRTNSSWRSLPGKSGVQKQMEFKFPQKRSIRQIGIRNGSGTGAALFTYNRAKRIQFVAGKIKMLMFLRDGDSEEQRFTLPEPVLTDRVILMIEDIYPGNQSKQTAITDVYFYY